MAPFVIICFLLLGLMAGTLSGLLGIGGGVIIVPALVFLFGLTQHCAQGATLALMVPPIGALAAWDYYKRGFVNIRIAALICAGFALGGYLGAILANDLSNSVLERVFGFALLLIALKMFFSKDRAQGENQSPDSKDGRAKSNSSLKSSLAYILLGVVAGALSGLIGIGGGVLIVPALVFLFGLSQHEAQGTTLALMVPPIGLFAALEYYRLGSVKVPVAGLVCAGFFLGALLGAKLANRMSNRMLARIFGLGMILIALKMLLAS